MKRRLIIEHIPSSKIWESDWIETKYKVNAGVDWIKDPTDVSLTFPYNGSDVLIPSAILNVSVMTTEYMED